jgi:uridine kinase
MSTQGDARGEVLSRLVSLVKHRLTRGSLRVAIDGIDAAGKTTLADELAVLLEDEGCAVLRASIDGFHRPASVRHLRGDLQPAQSYYEDSFDYQALRGLLLDPLGPDGDRLVRDRVFDFRIDQSVEESPIRVRPGTALLFDGVFLLRPELEGCWDLSVFVQVDPAVSLQRALKRDVALFGTRDAAERWYRERYLPGQELYMSQVHPDQGADVLIDNNDFTSPELLRIPPA